MKASFSSAACFAASIADCFAARNAILMEIAGFERLIISCRILTLNWIKQGQVGMLGWKSQRSYCT